MEPAYERRENAGQPLEMAQQIGPAAMEPAYERRENPDPVAGRYTS